jgi:hypothetical protein
MDDINDEGIKRITEDAQGHLRTHEAPLRCAFKEESCTLYCAAFSRDRNRKVTLSRGRPRVEYKIADTAYCRAMPNAPVLGVFSLEDAP